MAIPFAVSGGDPRALALFIAIANLFVPLGLFVLGKKMGSVWAGLLGATIAAFSPLLIGYSTQIWNPNLVPPLVMAAMLLWYGIVEKKGEKRDEGKRWGGSWWAHGFLLGLIINFQISFGLALVFSFLPWFAHMLFKRRLSWRNLGFFLVGFISCFLPLFFFDLRHNFIESHAVSNFLGQRTIRGRDYDAFPLRDKLENRVELFWQSLTETLGSVPLAVGVLGFMIIAVVYLWRRQENQGDRDWGENPLFWLLVNIGLIFLFFMLYADTVWNYYLVGLPVLYLGVLVMTIAGLQQHITILRQKALQTVVIATLFLLLFPYQNIAEWLGLKKSWVGDASVFRNQIAILDYIYQDVKDRELNVMVYTPPIYDYHYQYLFGWYGLGKYGKVPGTERRGNLYLIMEPNRDEPWLWEGWIKTVVLDPGQVQSRQEFPGGVVVEKRLIN